MTTITLCSNKKCGIRSECYRADDNNEHAKCFTLINESKPNMGCEFFTRLQKPQSLPIDSNKHKSLGFLDKILGAN